MLTEPTPDQRRAFDLIDTPSPSPSPRSQNNQPAKPAKPQVSHESTHPPHRNFGLRALREQQSLTGGSDAAAP